MTQTISKSRFANADEAMKRSGEHRSVCLHKDQRTEKSKPKIGTHHEIVKGSPQPA
jgi:hypothetical protein